MFNNKKKASNKELREVYLLINDLIKDGKIQFKYYDSTFTLELLDICENKVNNTVDIRFRDVFKEYVDTFKSISKGENI